VSNRILVWDLPLRVFHWVLAASFAGAFLTAESERVRDCTCSAATPSSVRSRSACCGASSAPATRASRRCASGPGKPRYLLSLLRGRPDRHLGHNPPGAVMIPLLLGLGLAIAASGWAVYADAGGEWLAEAHEIAATVMLVAVAGHVLGVMAVSVLQRENLVLPLVTGRKRGAPGEGIRSSRPLAALLLLIALAGLWLPGIAARERRLAASAQSASIAAAGEPATVRTGHMD